MAEQSIQIEMVPLDKLSLFPGNPRIMSERMMESLIASIQEFGVVDPVIALPDGRIIGGNQRLEAAKKAGLKELPVVRVKLSETKAKKLNLALNRIAGTWNDDGLAEWLKELAEAEEDLFSAGFEEEAISQLLAEYDQRHFEPQADEDEIPETPEEPVTKRGDIWQCGRHRVMCGDSTKAEEMGCLLAGGKVQGIFTSPPYAEQRKEQYGGIPAEQYVAWWEPIQVNMREALNPDGSFFVNIKAHCQDGERVLYVMDLVLAMKRRWEWKYVDEFCWLNPGIPGAWPNRFKDGWESVFQFCITAMAKFRPSNVTVDSEDCFNGEGGMRGRGHGTSYLGEKGPRKKGQALPSNVCATGFGEGGHPASFPVELPSFFVKAFSDESDSWLDPFLGSGTTMIAAEKLGRTCYGMEICETYCDVAVKRWELFTGQKAKLLTE